MFYFPALKAQAGSCSKGYKYLTISPCLKRQCFIPLLLLPYEGAKTRLEKALKPLKLWQESGIIKINKRKCETFLNLMSAYHTEHWAIILHTRRAAGEYG
uniref:Uncharacterized protein n=1 Tax=Micrurus paraensis TaxID=1970185 RepID=A0A2D4KPI5_9SAUR